MAGGLSVAYYSLQPHHDINFRGGSLLIKVIIPPLCSVTYLVTCRMPENVTKKDAILKT